MALAPDGIIVAARQPSVLLRYGFDGTLLWKQPTCGDADDVFYDPRRGEGRKNVIGVTAGRLFPKQGPVEAVAQEHGWLARCNDDAVRGERHREVRAYAPQLPAFDLSTALEVEDGDLTCIRHIDERLVPDSINLEAFRMPAERDRGNDLAGNRVNHGDRTGAIADKYACALDPDIVCILP